MLTLVNKLLWGSSYQLTRMKTAIVLICSALLLVSCDSDSGTNKRSANDGEKNQEFGAYDDIFLNQKSLFSFKEVLTRIGLIENWDPKRLDEILKHSEFAGDEASFGFMLGDGQVESYCSVSIQFSESLAWSDIENNKVFMFSVTIGEKYSVYIYEKDCYVLHDGSVR